MKSGGKQMIENRSEAVRMRVNRKKERLGEMMQWRDG